MVRARTERYRAPVERGKRRGNLGRSVAAVALVVGCHAPLPGPAPCDAVTQCGGACVLGRCREAGSIPASTLARRLSLAASEVLLLGDEEGDRDVRGVALGEATLLLRWPLEELDRALAERAARVAKAGAPRTAAPIDRGKAAAPGSEPVQRALLVLEPLPDRPVEPGTLALEVAEILEPWAATSTSARSIPRTGLPMRAGSVATAPRRPLRLDVTELLRAWSKGTRGHGLALVATPRGGGRAWYALSGPDRVSPRLEVYLAPDGTETLPVPATPGSTEPARAPNPDESRSEEDAE